MKKSLMSAYIVILTISMIGWMISCQQPVKTVYVTDSSPKETVMNDFTVKPIKECSAYYVAPSGTVFGIHPDVRIAADMDLILPIITVGKKDIERSPVQFFVTDEVIYFSMMHYFPPVDPENPEDNGEMLVKYCKQTAGVIEYLNKASFPVKPDVARGVFDDGEASLKVGDYNGEPISVAHRVNDSDTYEERFILADGMIRVDGGYMIHVVENSHPSRPPGLLYWPDKVSRMDPMGMDAGRFWAM